jgi:hypothetical protein
MSDLSLWFLSQRPCIAMASETRPMAAIQRRQFEERWVEQALGNVNPTAHF